MFDQSIIQLAHYRKMEAQAKEQRRQLVERFENSEEYLKIEEQLKETRAEIKEIDRQIRADAVQHYEITGEKDLHPAIGIRMVTSLDYERDYVFDWCLEHLPLALTINKRFFEKHAKAVSETAPVPGVTIEKIPQATISKNLDPFL